MFRKLSDHLNAKYSRKDNLSRQLEIVTVFDAYKEEIKKRFPPGTGTRPISLRNKILTVETSSAVMANELRLAEGQILEKINTAASKESVKRIRYRF